MTDSIQRALPWVLSLAVLLSSAQALAAPKVPPTLDTPTATNIGQTTATLGATILTPGSKDITTYGVCWNTGGADTCVQAGTGPVATPFVFTVGVTGLPAGTQITYYGYAYNGEVTSNYGTTANATFTTQAAASTTVGNGSPAATTTSVCPGDPAVFLDAFDLSATVTADAVTSVTVTTTNTAGVGSIYITNASNVQQGSPDTTPTGDTWTISGLSLGAPIGTPVQYKVWMVPATHAAAAGTWAVQGRVSAVVATNTVVNNDAVEGIITVDNTAPASAANVSGAAGNQQVVLSWNSVTDVMVVRSLDANFTAPTEGTNYTTANSIGGDPVVFVSAAASTGFTDGGLNNGTPYYYAVYVRDGCSNWSPGVPVGPYVPFAPTTTVGNGSPAAPSASVCPGDAAVFLDAFDLSVNAGSDTVTSVTVTTTNTTGVGSIYITNGTNVQQGLPDTTPTGNTWTISGLSLNAPLGTPAQYKVWMVPAAHAAAAGTYAVQGSVTAVVAANAVVVADSQEGIITVDNAAPADATGVSGSVGNQQVVLSWNSVTDVMVVRSLDANFTAPTEGTNYTTADFIGGDPVAFVSAAASTGYTDSGLNNGTPYYYKVYVRDACSNWSPGVPVGPYTPFAPTTTVGNGSPAATNASVCPEDPAVFLDAFDLSVNAGSADTVTSVTITTTGTAGVGSIYVTNSSNVQQGLANTTPTGNTWTISGLSLNAPLGTPAQYKVWMVPATHAAPAGSYVVQGSVTAASGTNTVVSSDAQEATVTVDNAAPADPTPVTGTPGNTQVTVSWSNATNVMALRSLDDTFGTPTEGASYSTSDFIGGDPVVFVSAAASTGFTDVGLTNGTPYYYRVLVRDGCGNWSTGATTGPHVPIAAQTTVGNGTDPGNASLNPGGAATMLDAFTLQTSAGTDVVTQVVVTLSGSTYVGLSLVEITTDDGTLVRGSVANPASGIVAINVSNITATTTSTPYKVRITPRSHLNMPVPPGATYAVTGTVTAIASTYGKVYNDSTSATVTIDNASPADATWGTSTAGDTLVVLNWTNPVADFNSVVIVRSTSTPITDKPTEGVDTYAAGNPLGGSVVRYVGSLETFTDTGLTNGTDYYYKIFTRDAAVNYAVGVQTGAYRPAAAGTAIGTISGVVDACNQLTISAPFTGDGDNDGTVTVRRKVDSCGGNWNGATVVCSNLSGPSPRLCVDNTVAENSTYCYQVDFADPDGLTGTDLQTSLLTTSLCPVNGITAGTASLTVDSCSQLTVTAPFAGDQNDDSTVLVEYNTTNTWTGSQKTACTGLGGPSPRTCVIQGLTASTLYYVRVTYADPDGVTGSAVQTPSATTTACTSNGEHPMVMFRAPARDAVVGGLSRFMVQVYDPDGVAIANVKYALDSPTATLAMLQLSGVTCNLEGQDLGDCLIAYVDLDTTALANGDHYLAVKATDSEASPLSTQLTQPFTVQNVGTVAAGDGLLLRRTLSPQLCTDCHDYPTHGSQAMSAKYGAWAMDCLVCHTPHATANIFLVRQSITTPSSGAKSVDFRYLGDETGKPVDWANYALTNAGTPGTGVCEVCHTKTTQFRNDVSSPGNNGHPTSDCGTCHGHEVGFAPAGCDGCHGGGNNAVADTNYWPDGQGSPLNPEDDQAGRHAAHMAELAAVMFNGESLAQLKTDTVNGTTDAKQKQLCAYCHPDPLNSSFAPGGAGTSWSEVHNKGSVQVGGVWGHRIWDTYVPAGFATTDGDWTVTAGACANTDCHNNKTTVAPYNWADAGASACVMCHNDPTSTGSHGAHLAAATATTYGVTLTCDSCHADGAVWGTSPPSAQHLDGAWTIDQTYTGSWPSTKGSCGVNGCHNNGQNSPPRTAAYTWDTTTLTGCVHCHGDTVATLASQAHNAHLNASGTFGKVIACANCHGTDAEKQTEHMLGSVNLVSPLDTAYGAGNLTVATNGGTFGSCGTNLCHNDGKNAAPKTSPYPWNTTIANCDACHETAVGSLATASHGPHLTAQAAFGISMTCDTCHSAATVTTHLDASVSLTGLTYSNTPGSLDVTVANTFGSCGTNNCHNNGKDGAPKTSAYLWNTPIANCDACHETTNLANEAHGAHLTAAINYGVSVGCADCHAAETDATHLNRLVTLEPTLAGKYTGQPGSLQVASATFGNCATNVCHNDGTGVGAPARVVAWNLTMADDCASCHLGAGMATNGHDAHLASNALPNAAVTFGSGDECVVCHATSSTGGGKANGVNHLNGTRELAFQTAYGYEGGTLTRAGSGPTSTCATAKCHNGVATPAWNVTPITCGQCHNTGAAGPLPAAASVKGSHDKHANNDATYTDCQNCHASAATYTSKSSTGGPASHQNLVVDLWINGGSGSYTDADPAGVNFVAGDGLDDGQCATSGCHGAGTPVWGGTLSGGCFDCHAGTEAVARPVETVDGSPNVVSNTEYDGQGHGKTGSYLWSGNAGADFDHTYTGMPNAGCYECHDAASQHSPQKSATDPYRLGVFAANTDGLCDACHGPTGAAIKIDLQEHTKAITGSTRTWPNNYGFKCVDCHDPHGDANHYMVRSSISAPLNATDVNVGSNSYGTPKQSQANLSAVSFTSQTGLGAGSYAIAGTGDGICEVCHNQTTVYDRTGLDNNGSHSTGDCMSCHDHKEGFKGSGCSGCHGGGTVGTVASNFWPDGLNANLENTAGSHAKHVEQLAGRVYGLTLTGLLNDAASEAKQKELCAYCHTNPGADADHGNAANLPAEVNSFYELWEVPRATLDNGVWNAAGSGTCATVDCHNNVTTPAANEWYDPAGSSACSMCHSINPTTDVPHTAHTGSAGTYGRTIVCNDCHADGAVWSTTPGAGTPPSTGHLGGTWTLDQAYTGVWTTGANGTCGTNACHESGLGAAPARAYTWGTALTDDCASCHLGAAMASNAHDPHLASNSLPAAALTFGSTDECVACHATSATGTGRASGVNHLNSTTELAFQTAFGYEAGAATRSGSGATSTCGTVRCHNGVTTPAWNVTPITCGKCHNTSGTGPLPSDTSTGRSHPAHANNDATYTDCQTCHASASTYTAHGGHANHMNLAVELSFNAGAGVYTDTNGRGGVNYVDGSETPDLDNGTCATSGCHGAGTPTWGGTLTGGCFACHDGTEPATRPVETVNGTPNVVNSTQYGAAGHGQTGAHTGSGTTGAGYTVATNGCYNCHDINAQHSPSKSATDPYRLGAFATNTNGLCDACHGPLGTAAKIDLEEHSKAITGSTKTWPGGNYAFKCVDCHDPHGDTNYLMVRSHIAAPTTSGDAAFGSNSYGTPQDVMTAVTFTSLAGFAANSFAISGTTTYGICEVCHNQTTVYKRGTDAGTHATSDCRGCHDHKAGFKGSGCSGCHGGGTSGTVASNFWPDGLNANLENTAGSHAKHVEQLAGRVYGLTLTGLLNDAASEAKQKELCAYCHTNPGADADHGNAANLPAEVNTFYELWEVPRATLDNGVWNAAGNGTCASVDCHNNVTTPAANEWYDAAGSSACSMCHSINPTTDVPHTAHTGSAGTYGRTIVCNDCHVDGVVWSTTPGAGTPPLTGHLGGTWTLDQAYTGSWPSTKGSCGTNACHENGLGAAPARAYTWGTALTNDCASCHLGDAMATNAHVAHLTSNSLPNATNRNECYACHNTTATSGGLATAGQHLNGTTQVAFSTTGIDTRYQGVAAGKTGTGAAATCSSVRCHSGVTTPTWSSSVLCEDCHSNTGVPSTATDARPGPTSSGTWRGHGIGTHTNGTPSNCDMCHPNADFYTANGGHANHQNLSVNVLVDPPNVTTVPYVTDATPAGVNWVSGTAQVDDGTCAGTGTGCHETRTVTWGGTDPGMTCPSCHTPAAGTRRAIGPEFSTFTSHHIYNSGGAAPTAVQCSICHAEGNTTGGTTAAHKDGTVDLKNVDTGLEAYTNWPALTPTQRTDFCFKCHDGDGATAAPGGGLNPFTDTLTPTHEAGILNGAQSRTRVINVWKQFDPLGASHHAVRQAAYSSQPSTVLSSANLFNTAVVTANGANMGWTVKLECEDCHYGSATTKLNGHGTSTARYMLRGPTGGDEATGYTGCLRCHKESPATSNADAGHTQGGNHYADTGKQLTLFRIGCLNCHGGGWVQSDPDKMFGAVHGVPRDSTTLGYKPNVFTFGSAIDQAGPTPVGTGTWGGPTGSTTRGCSVKSSSTNLAACTQHTGANAKTWTVSNPPSATTDATRVYLWP